MLKTTEIANLLNLLATSFEKGSQAPQDTGAPKESCGWGQFLDVSKPHKQVGLYGTSAGLITLAVAGRGSDTLSTQAAKLLEYWWKSRSDPASYSYEKLLQIPRLAFLTLSLRLSRVPEIGVAATEAKQALLERQLPSGLWSDFWISESDHDPSPRLFPSALALLAVSLLKSDPTYQDPKLSGSADALEELFMSTEDLPTYQEATVAAALLSTKGGQLRGKVVSRIRQMALASRKPSGEGGVYFYDFEYFKDSEREYGRDYFIIPTELVLGIAGLQDQAPSALRLLAEEIATRVGSNIRANKGYWSPSEQRYTSNNQAWAALLLHSAQTSSWQRYRLGRVLAKFGYELRRERIENSFTEVWLPFLAMLTVVISGVLLKNQGGLDNGVVAVAALMIGGLYGPEVVRKVFPGRQ